jgi:gamma-glutamylcyclotransferase (GGCT)/AIG2-like uncharacterized protein YtfP
MHVFAYGTLMEPAVMTAVTGQRFSSLPAELRGYGRFCVQNAVYPGLVAQPAAVTQGVLYCEVDADALASLDTFEAAMYDRRSLAIDVDERPTGRRSLSAEVYVTRSSARARLSSEKWDLDQFRRLHLGAYLQRCAR